MSTEQLSQSCEDAFFALLHTDATEALSLVTALFVGTVVELARQSGANVDCEIKIDGGTSRDITIHPTKTS